MKKILLFLTVMLLISTQTFAQSQTSDQFVKKAVEHLKQKGYTTQYSGGEIAATKGNETYQIFVATNAYLPVFQIATQVASYDCTSSGPLSAYKLVNQLNSQPSFIKFTMSMVYAGDWGIMNGMSSDDVMSVNLFGIVQSFFSTEDQLIMILDDCLTTFISLKANMPKSLE